MPCLKEAGLTVPDDISVAGFDGIDAGEYYIPSITTIRQPVEQLAAETAKMLFSLISGKEEPCSKVYDGELVVRNLRSRGSRSNKIFAVSLPRKVIQK